MHLTKRQYEILSYIATYQDKHGYAPTLAEVGEALDITRMTVHEHVTKMQKKGVLAKTKDESRSIQILHPELLRPSPKRAPLAKPSLISTQPMQPARQLPWVGFIAAGAPIEAIEQDETFALDSLIPLGRQCYVLRVKGDSMIEDGIHDGDFVIVEKTSTARNGETVVAIIDDNEATLKRYYRENGRIRLQPANAALQPIYRDHVEIRGIVKGIYRKM